MAFWRREPAEPTVPRDVRGRLDFVRGERLLASSLDESGTWVVVTTAALYAVPPHGEVLARPWLRLNKCPAATAVTVIRRNSL